MRTQTVQFSNFQADLVFPEKVDDLGQAVSALRLKSNYPVLVLIGGHIYDQHLEVTQRAIQVVAKVVEDLNALIVCGGTMGVMAVIAEVRTQNKFRFPLVGIAPEGKVTWPNGPKSNRFLWWGKERDNLATGYSHFILVPGRQFGDESPWISEAARYLSQGNKSATVLMNGGNISRKDIGLSLKAGRPIIAVAGTGRLADELAAQKNRHELIKVVPVNDEHALAEIVRGFLV